MSGRVLHFSRRSPRTWLLRGVLAGLWLSLVLRLLAGALQ
jgi:hypothetical protein